MTIKFGFKGRNPQGIAELGTNLSCTIAKWYQLNPLQLKERFGFVQKWWMPQCVAVSLSGKNDKRSEYSFCSLFFRRCFDKPKVYPQICIYIYIYIKNYQNIMLKTLQYVHCFLLVASQLWPWGRVSSIKSFFCTSLNQVWSGGTPQHATAATQNDQLSPAVGTLVPKRTWKDSIFSTFSQWILWMAVVTKLFLHYLDMSWFWSFAVSLLQTFQTFLNYLQAQLQSYAENYSSVHLDAHNLLLAAGSLDHCEDLRSESAQQGSGFERSWSTPLTAQRSWSKERPFHLKRKQEKSQAWTPVGNYNTTDMYWSWMVWLGRRISIQKNEPLPEHYLRPRTVWAFWNAWRILEEHTYKIQKCRSLSLVEKS